METLLQVGFFVALVVLLAVVRLIAVRRQNTKLNIKRFGKIKGLYDLIESGQEITIEEVRPYASDMATRELVHELLKDRKRLDLFPPEYNNWVSASESNLVNWLMYPTELGREPDTLEHIRSIELNEDLHYRYELFRFKVNEPHKMATLGWLWGVVGPYYQDSSPYDFPEATFSRFHQAIEGTEYEEVEWVHGNILHV